MTARAVVIPPFTDLAGASAPVNVLFEMVTRTSPRRVTVGWLTDGALLQSVVVQSGPEPVTVLLHPNADISPLVDYRVTVQSGQHTMPPVYCTLLPGTDPVQLAELLAVGVLTTSSAFVPVPATPTSPGTMGQQAWDGLYLYTCIATDTWVRRPVERTW